MRQQCASSLQFVPLPPSSLCWGHWHDLCLCISVSSVLIFSIIFQKSIEYLVTCSRHLARVAPSSVSLYGKRDHPRGLIDLLVNEGLQHVKDELGFMWIWTGFIHSFSFLRSCAIFEKLNSCLFPLKSSTYYFLRVIKCSRANIWLRANLFICQIIWIKFRKPLLWILKLVLLTK